MGAIFDNPISAAQLRLRGGWKTLSINSGVYALIIAFAMALWSQVDPKHLRDAAQGWTIILMFIQALLVVLFSIVRITGAVRQDNTSGIMESHRLMPITGLTACIGFLVGPSIQMIAIGLVTCAAGVVSCAIAGFAPERWLMSNLILLVFLAFAGSYGVLVGFYRRALFNVVIVILIVGLFSRGLLLYAIPAVAVLFSPLAGDTVFSMQSTADIFNTGIIWAFVGQAIFAAILLTAAARKFRQPDRPAFSVSLSLILLAAWVVLNLIGMLQWEMFEPWFLHYGMGTIDDRLTTQFTGSVLTAILISLLPIVVAIRARREHADHMASSPIENAPRHDHAASRVMTILICMALVCLLLDVPIFQTRHMHKMISRVALSIVASIASLAALLCAHRSTTRKTVSLMLVFLLATWFGPLFADIVEHSIVLDYYDANRAPWSITGFGPLGTMMSPWNPEMQTMAGLYWQLGVAVLMVLIALLVEQKRRKMHRAARPTDSSLPIPPLPA